MSSRVLIPALLLAAVAASGAAGAAFVGDWGDFTARSDRGADSLLISVMENGDFGTSFAICSSIGKRSDPYAADILSWLLSGYSTTRSYQTETLLRRALASLFDEDGPDLSSRVSSNADVLGELVRTLETFKDPQLRGIIVRLLPRLPEDGRMRALMVTGMDLVDELLRTGGTLSPQMTSLAFDYLAVVQVLGTSDFFDQCLSVSRLSRDTRVVEGARRAARALSGSH